MKIALTLITINMRMILTSVALTMKTGLILDGNGGG